MKVKVGDTVFDGDVLPVMVILDEDDKRVIRNLSREGSSKYCAYPDKIADEVIDKWMVETDNEFKAT